MNKSQLSQYNAILGRQSRKQRMNPKTQAPTPSAPKQSVKRKTRA